jgi:apolipoprotein N-acyltransferase
VALRSFAFAVLAGLLVGLAGAPTELSFPAFLAPAFFMVALEPRAGEPVRARRALWIGLAAGFATNAYSMYWVVGLLMDYGGFPLPLALLVGALLWIGQSLGWMGAAILTVALVTRRIPSWLVVPAALTVAASLAPAIFPWRYGLSQLGFLPYAQVAELGGLPLLDWLVATVGCGLVAFARSAGRPRVPLALAATAFVLPVVYGAIRLPQVEAERERAPLLHVGVVQPNVGILDKHDPSLHAGQLADQRATTRELEGRGAQLVVWPESAYPFPIHRDATRDRRGPLGLHEDGVRGPLIVGVITTDGALGTAIVRDRRGAVVGTFRMGTGERFNSAIAVEADGHIAGIADKVRLLAFGEYTPFWELIPWLQVFPRGLTPGVGPQILSIAGTNVGVLNCYEDLLPDHVRWQAGFAPALFVNVTNDAWFGDTTAPYLHHMNARLRAIETRRDLVRAVNTGVSGHTAATGEDLRRTPPFERAAFVADARLLSGTTPWVWLGDWLSPILAALLGALALDRRRS